MTRVSAKIFGADKTANKSAELVKLSGVSVKFLQKLRTDLPNHAAGLTLNDILQTVVLDKMRDNGTQMATYLDIINPDDVGPLLEGAFVCIPHESSFGELVDSLVKHCEESDVDLSEQFVWLDIFCTNQPALILGSNAEANREAALEQVYGAIADFDQRFVYVGSWTDSRSSQLFQSGSWVLWTIYGCIKSGRNFKFLSRVGNEEEFINAILAERSGAIAERIFNTNIANGGTSTYHRDFKVLLPSALAALDAFDVEQAINLHLQESFYEYMLQALDARRQNTRLGSQMSLALVLFACGSFLHDQLSMHDEALQMLNESMQLFESLGAEKAAITTTLDRIAQILHYKGEYDAALEMFEEVLRVEVDALGDDTAKPVVANTIENIARVLIDKGDYDRALERLEEAFHIKDKLVQASGEDSLITTEHGPRIAKSLRLIAQVLQLKGDYEGALDRFSEAVRICENAFRDDGGRSNPQTVEGIVAMAACLNHLNQVEKSLDLLNQVRASKACVKEIEAKEHCVRGVALRLQGDTTESIAELERCLELRHRMRQNASHIGVQEAQYELGLTFVQHGDSFWGKAILQKELVEREKRYAMWGQTHPRIFEVKQAIASV